MILLLSAAWWAARRYEARLLAERRTDVALENSLYGNALSAIVNRRLARLQGLYAYAQATPHDGTFASGFDDFASGLYAASEGIRSFAVAPVGVVAHVYPLFGNETILGYEPLKDPFPAIRADAQLALRTGLLVLSVPYRSVDGELQIVAQQAVYKEGHFWGFVRIVLDLPFLLEEAGLGASSDDLSFALRTGDGRAFYGDPDVFGREPAIGQIDLPGTRWELAAVPSAGWESDIREPLRVAQAAGALIVALLTSLTFLTVNRQQRLALAVQQRTRQITQVNEALQKDVAERRRMEAALREREGQYRGIFEATGDALIILEVNGIILDVNPAACSMHGYQRHDLVGSSGRKFLHPDHDPWFDELKGAVGAGQSFTAQAVHARSDGEPIPVEVHGSAFRYAGRICLLAVVRDISERLAVMEERTRLARDLHDSVTQSLYSLTLFAEAGRAHAGKGELRRLQHQLQRIGETAQHALAEMRLLLYELRPPVLDQEGLIGALHRRLEAVERRAGLQARLLAGELLQVPPQVEECLYRIATEALNNALKHAQAATVTVYLRSEGHCVVLEIVDDGVGFEVDKGCAGGLGLTGMRERAERCHGSLTVCSAPGSGTRVTARLKSEVKSEAI